MTELMIKMTSWLLASMFLGFIVAWFLSRIIYRRKQNSIEDMFDAAIVERNNTIDELEKKIRNEREALESVSNELENSKEALAEKTSHLTTLQNRLNSSNSNETINFELREKNTLLSIENKKLEEIDRKRMKELKSFEEVLLLAEDKIEESEKAYVKVVEKLNEEIAVLSSEKIKDKEHIKVAEKRIKSLEKELKLYRAESEDSEFIISRDQFFSVEEQLRKYQKEIDVLKKANSELLLKLKKSDIKIKV